MKKLALLLIVALTTACANKSVQAPVPGTINTFDAYTARTLGDAQSALQNTKAWEMCSDQKFPSTITFDNSTYSCDATAGPFPSVGRQILYKAEQSYNIALAAAQAYHAGATSDTTVLAQSLTQLGLDIGSMLTSIGKGK